MKLVSFKNAYPLELFVKNPLKIRTRKVALAKTKDILKHFRGRKNILNDCVQEIRRLDEKCKTCKVVPKVRCDFQANGCKRWGIK